MDPALPTLLCLLSLPFAAAAGMGPALAILLCLLSLPLGAASGATLIEMTAGAEPVRLLIDRPKERVVIERSGRRTWFDLSKGLVYHRTGDGPAERAPARYRPGHDEPPPYRIERFGPGPIIAGQAGTYHVLFAADRICAEMMLSKWMLPFLDPAIRAIALIQQLHGLDHRDPCAEIPFTTYAAAGWPLMAGTSDRPTLANGTIAFDYDAAPEELTPPATFVDVPLERLRAALAGYGW
jgi:hypothetical protein